MRKLWLLLLIPVLVVVGYGGLPYLTTWQLMRAIEARDAATLAPLVDWPGVRASLKGDLAEIARAELQAALPKNRFSELLVKGFGDYLAPTLVDQMIERFVTPSGIVDLADTSRDLKKLVKPDDHKPAADPKALPPAPGQPAAGTQPTAQPTLSTGNRLALRSAWFVDLETFRFELTRADRTDRAGLVGILRLEGRNWRLVRLNLPRRDLEVATDKPPSG